jgi:hypothetical protein
VERITARCLSAITPTRWMSTNRGPMRTGTSGPSLFPSVSQATARPVGNISQNSNTSWELSTDTTSHVIPWYHSLKLIFISSKKFTNKFMDVWSLLTISNRSIKHSKINLSMFIRCMLRIHARVCLRALHPGQHRRSQIRVYLLISYLISKNLNLISYLTPCYHN